MVEEYPGEPAKPSTRLKTVVRRSECAQSREANDSSIGINRTEVLGFQTRFNTGAKTAPCDD